MTDPDMAGCGLTSNPSTGSVRNIIAKREARCSSTDNGQTALLTVTADAIDKAEDRSRFDKANEIDWS